MTARQLEEIFTALQGTIKTRQQASVAILISLLRDASDPIGSHFDALSKQYGSKEEQFSCRVNEWSQLFIVFCKYYAKVLEDAKGKKTNYNTTTLTPATDTLIELSNAIRRHNILLTTSAVDCVLEMITSSIDILYTEKLFARMTQAYQMLIGKCESQGVVGTPSKFRGAVGALLNIINLEKQTQGGFQRVAEFLRHVIASTNSQYFFQGSKVADFVSLLCQATSRSLEHTADPVTAKELVSIINMFLKRHLINDVERLAVPITTQLNDFLAARLSDQRIHEGLLHSIVACLQIQMRIFIRPDGELIEIPCFQQLAVALRRHITTNSGITIKNVFFTSPSDKLIRMDPSAFKVADLMSDIVFRLHLLGSSWPDSELKAPTEEPASKRRKLGESAIETVLQTWSGCKDSELTSWTRILLVFVSKYPKCLKIESVLQLLQNASQRCSKVTNNPELECYLIFSLVELLKIAADATDPNTLAPVLSQLLENFSIKLAQNKVGSSVFEAAMRGMNALLENPALVPLFQDVLEGKLLTTFNATILKSPVYSQNTVSMTSALAARLANNYALLVGGADEKTLPEQLFRWALSCFTSLMTRAGEESTMAVSDFGCLISNLLRPAALVDAIPAFVPLDQPLDEDMIELAPLESMRLINDDLSPARVFGRSTRSSQGATRMQHNISRDLLTILITWLNDSYAKLGSSTTHSQRLVQCLSVSIPTCDQLHGLDSLLKAVKDATVPNHNSMPSSVTPSECSAWNAALQRFHTPVMAPFRESIANYCLMRIEKAISRAKESSSTASPRKLNPSPIVKVQAADVMEVDLDDSFDHPSMPSLESPGSFSGEAAAQHRGMVSVLMLLLQDTKFRKDSALRLDELLASVTPEINSQLLSAALSEKESSLSEGSVELLSKICRRSMERTQALEPEVFSLSTSQWRSITFSNLRRLLSLWSKSGLKRKAEFTAFVNWCADFTALAFATASIKSAIVVNRHGECERLTELLSELVVSYTGNEHEILIQELVDMQNSSHFVVRRCFASAVTSVFQVFDDHMKPFSDLVDNIPSDDSVSTEQVASSAMLLSSLASCSLQLELSALSELVSRFFQPSSRRIVSKVLQKTASGIGYRSAALWLRQQAGFLLMDLQEKGLPPLLTLGELLCVTSHELLHRFSGEIVAYAAAAADTATLDVVRKTLGVSESELVLCSYPVVYARLLPHLLDKSSGYHQRALKFFEMKKWPPSNAAKNESLAASSGVVIGEILCSTSTQSLMDKCLDHFSKVLGPSNWATILTKNGQLHTLMLIISQYQAASNREFQRRKCEECVQFVFNAFKHAKLLDHPGVAAEYVIACIRMKMFQQLSSCLEAIKSCTKVAPALGFIVPQALSLLLRQLTQNISNEAETHLLACFKWFWEQEELDSFLHQTVLIPRQLSPSLASLQACVDKQRILVAEEYKTKSWEFIKHIVKSAASIYVPPCAQQESLTVLSVELKKGEVLSPETLRFVSRQLFALAKGPHDDNTRSLAMECLSAIDMKTIPTLMDQFPDEPENLDPETELQFPFIRAEATILSHLLHLINSDDCEIATLASSAFVQVSSCSRDHLDVLETLVGGKGLSATQISIKIPVLADSASTLPDGCLSWLPSDTFRTWICRCTSSLLKSTRMDQLRACSSLCNIYQPLAVALFPHAFAAISQEHPRKLKEALQSSVFGGLNFPTEVLEAFGQAFVTTLRLSLTNSKSSRRAALSELFPAGTRRDVAVSQSNAALNKLNRSSLIWENDDFWNQIDLVEVTGACLLGGSPLSALQFFELAAERDPSKQSESVLVDICEKLNEPDFLEALSSLSLFSEDEWRVQALLYSQEAKWHDAIALYNQQLTTEKDSDRRMSYHRKIIEALTNDGQLQVAESYLNGISPSDFLGLRGSHIKDLRAMLGWRMRKWDPTAASEKAGSLGLNPAFLTLLSLQNQQNIPEMEIEMKHLRSLLLQRLPHSHDLLKSAVEITQYQSLSEMISALKSNDKDELRRLTHRWIAALRESSRHPQRFDSLEPLSIMRNLMIGSIPNTSATAMLQLARIRATSCREACRFQLAASSVAEMNSQLNSLKASERSKYLVNFVPSKLEECQLSWARGDRLKAVQQLKRLLSFCETDSEFLGFYRALNNNSNHQRHLLELNEHLATAYSCAGDWFLETKIENSGTIQKHLDKAIKFFSTTSDPSRGHFELARFLDARWAALAQSERSPEAAAAESLRKRRKEELEESKKLLRTGRTDQKIENSVRKLELLVERDSKEADETTRMKSEIIGQTFQEWLTVLVHASHSSKEHILHAVFRVISIWFSTSDQREDLSRMMSANADIIPVERFLPLFYQMASRISSKSQRSAGTAATFQSALFKIIKLILQARPSDSLSTLYSLSQCDRVKDTHARYYQPDLDKKETAVFLLRELAKQDAKFKNIMDQTFLLFDAYVELAFQDQAKSPKHSSTSTARKSIPPKLSSMKNLSLVQVPTFSGSHDGAPHVFAFQPYYDLVGGVTAPKAIYCQGSDGRWYKQLVKGPSYASHDPVPDDLRQDAVMQQTFTLINSLLKLNPQARDRSLKMRTYRVVPLTPAAGVLEWVQGTSPLFEYLVGPAIRVGPSDTKEVYGAHHRFFPGDRSHTAIRTAFSHIANSPSKEKLDLFRKCCKEFRPVFHNYFLENYPNPLTCYTRRLAYVRSVATSSMIGYIIGLGDRHSSNILIDSTTAELVHIDLGVAFEQGKQLPIPELVPFRLTRDIVHGMGVSGIHGVFSESCERAMDVMRQQRQFIESIVEVFLHDPLFKWNVSPGRAQRLQRDESGADDALKMPSTATVDATATLLRLKQKLLGTEHGDTLSVQGQVRKLIQDAMDEDLLSRMFYGWAPWI